MAADKKQKKIEHQEEVERDPKLKECMDKLKEIQQKLFRLKAEARSKINEIEMQFTEIRRPIYEKRTEIIKTIPEFWMGVFMCHPRLQQFITEQDQEILPYLSTLEVQDGEKQNSDFVIIFRFDPNPFFGNSLLVRSYTFLDDGSVQRFWSVIDWKMQTKEIEEGTSRGSEGNKCFQYNESGGFFSWFDGNHVDILPKDISDEIAVIIKEELWPNPLKFLYEGPHDDEPEEVQHGSVVGSVDEEEEDELKDTASS